ncbi:MAG: AAA family ATPase [Pyrinomonadaceae bacterium]
MNRPQELSNTICAFALRNEGWTVDDSIKDEYQFEALKPDRRVAVRIYNSPRRLQLSQIEKFVRFLSSPSGAKFTSGLIISTGGFSTSIESFLAQDAEKEISIALLKGTELIRNSESLTQPTNQNSPLYLGVFTCKGGVGKTTVSAHLAGAFATNGHNVALLDLDKQQNLRRILGDGVHVPKFDGSFGSIVSVFDSKEWDEEYYTDTKIVICDCNPEFTANPEEILRRFDYCIMPTTLNPLGISKGGDVIRRTLFQLRKVNPFARMFVLINNLQTDDMEKNRVLSEYFNRQLVELGKEDDLFQYIDPAEVSIRFSKQLLYWGYHIYENQPPELAFKKVGRYANPRVDFLKLVDYLENATVIGKLRTMRAC